MQLAEDPSISTRGEVCPRHRPPNGIEHWPIERLIPYSTNPRTHSDAQVALIASSIDEFGFNNPILVDTKAGIIAGHGRLLAARQLGLGEVPVIVLDHLSELQKRAYIIADLNIAEGSLEECRYYLILTHDLGYGQTDSLTATLEETSRLLNAYTRAILASGS